ncbi:MAG: class II fructose-bisphosphate aldolase [Clostridiales bacterium]|nr:class II fructose-bisphosphate aldolase [Clostridiales bacterium]
MKNNLFCRILADAQKSSSAVAAINILNHLTVCAVVKAAEQAGRPVILQPSVGTVRRYGVEALYHMINVSKRNARVPVALHLDHCMDIALAKACIRTGWDSVMVDFSALPFEENVARTREVVLYAHRYGVAVEGEIGIIAGVEDGIVQDAACPASFVETVAYVEQTGIDAVAPAIGTAHGLYTGIPKLNFTLVRELGRRYVPVVVHGGTGLPKEGFLKLIQCGAAKINISTALKQVYLGAARKALAEESIAPLTFDQAVEAACMSAMEAFIRLFA